MWKKFILTLFSYVCRLEYYISQSGFKQQQDILEGVCNAFLKNFVHQVIDVRSSVTIDPRRLKQWIKVPLVSATDSKQVIKSLCYSLHHNCCLQSSKFEANLTHATNFQSFKLFSVTYLELYLTRKERDRERP